MQTERLFSGTLMKPSTCSIWTKKRFCKSSSPPRPTRMTLNCNAETTFVRCVPTLFTTPRCQYNVRNVPDPSDDILDGLYLDECLLVTVSCIRWYLSSHSLFTSCPSFKLTLHPNLSGKSKSPVPCVPRKNALVLRRVVFL